MGNAPITQSPFSFMPHLRRAIYCPDLFPRTIKNVYLRRKESSAQVFKKYERVNELNLNSRN